MGLVSAQELLHQDVSGQQQPQQQQGDVCLVELGAGKVGRWGDIC
jgi:hypothetical protein